MGVVFGLDEVISQQPAWKNSRIGLVTNHAATTTGAAPGRLALIQSGFNITRLFSPEHGLRAIGEDGAFMANATDELTGLPVISLYGDKLAPEASDLDDLDLMLFDIADIGTRFYTYLWTMTHVLEACAKYRKPLVILDRPNPLSGLWELAEGPFLDENHCASFIGRWNIPLRHSCTIGELAIYFNHKRAIGADLKIVKCTGWRRDMFHPDWGPDFVPASPAMRSFTTALLYPGTGLFEATNVSEGRGTPSPFVTIGAPWLDTGLLLHYLEAHLKGVKLEKTSFIPEESKYQGQLCAGIRIIPKEVGQLRSVVNGLIMIKGIKDLFPEHFGWKTYPTHANPGGKGHLDKLLGIRESEALFEKSFTCFLLQAGEITGAEQWKAEISTHLLYQ